MRRAAAWILAVVGCAVSGAVAAQDDGDVLSATAKRAVSHAEWYARNEVAIRQRHDLVNEVMRSLQSDLVRVGASQDDSVRLQQMLHRMPRGLLEASRTLGSVRAVEAAARDGSQALPAHLRASVSAKGLGELIEDLIFIPHGPCRIVDTRFSAAGPIAGNTSRVFSNFSATGQGAPLGSCNDAGSGTGVGVSSGTGGALALTVTGAAPPTGFSPNTYVTSSFLTARPAGSTNVTATVLIEPGRLVTSANSTTIRASTGALNDFEVFAGITSHVIVDLLGFYVPPEQTPLDCTTVTAPLPLPAGVGQTDSVTVSCGVGYSLTGGGAFVATGTNNIVINKISFFSNTNLFCRVTNNTASAVSAQCEARCCRTPGGLGGRFGT